jgi:hypothetical protein
MQCGTIREEKNRKKHPIPGREREKRWEDDAKKLSKRSE